MVNIVTPLAQVLNPVRGSGQGVNLAAAAESGTRLQEALATGALNRDVIQNKLTQAQIAQKVSNLGQAALTGLDVIKQDPGNAEKNLRDFIAQRKAVLPQLGLDTTETDELEQALNEGGIGAAQNLLQSTLDAARGSGFKLPKPTTPDFKATFEAIDPTTGKNTIFLRAPSGVVSTGLLAPPKRPLVQVGPGGGAKERTERFGSLFDESKNLDKTLGQITQLREIVAKGGLGSIGVSGKATKGFQNAASAIGGFAKNFGLGSEEFDENSIVANALKGTPLGEQAIRNAKVSSLITNLAFAVARAQGNKRITDRDFEAAVKTLGANADNPEQLIDVINQFGENTLTQFNEDVTREGEAFGFTEKQFKLLRNFKSIKGFQKGITPRVTEITADTPLNEITREQAEQLAIDNPDLLREIIQRNR
jgi:hypothetical protein